MPNDKATPGQTHNDPATSETQDVGGFFTWANLDGSKYRDYSESREKSRAEARGRSEIQASAEEVVPPAPAQRDISRTAATPVRPNFAAPRKLTTIPRTRSIPPGPRRLPPRHPPRFQKQNENSRWVALKGSQDPELNYMETEGFAADELHLPTLAFISLAGGTGKTSIAASVGCLLAAEGNRILLVDTHVYGLMPLYFGAREVSPGTSRTFASADSAPIRVMTLDRSAHEDEHGANGEHSVFEQVTPHTSGVDRILIDVSTASTDLFRQILSFSPTLLVVLMPDMASVVSLQAVQQLLEDLEEESGQSIEVFYLLNQYDPSARLHRDVRERLTRQLGKRFLPFAVHRTHAVSEALAQGMTVVDYAPEAQATENLVELAHWVRELDEPVASEVRDVRWGER